MENGKLQREEGCGYEKGGKNNDVMSTQKNNLSTIKEDRKRQKEWTDK